VMTAPSREAAPTVRGRATAEAAALCPAHIRSEVGALGDDRIRAKSKHW